MNKNSLQKYLNWHSVGTRLQAIGLALLLWVFVVSENDYTLVMDMPIKARNLSAQKAHKKEVPEYAQVRLKGPGRVLFKTLLVKKFLSDFKLVIDLDRISEEYDFYLNEYYERYPQKVVLPPSYDLEYIEVVYPDSIHISLDEYMVKTVPVKSLVVISASPGYTLVGSQTIQPDLIEVAGPREVVEKMTYVETKKDTFLNQEIDLNTSLYIDKRTQPLLEYSHNTIILKQIIQPISERIVSEIPVKVVNALPNLRLFVNPTTVSLTIVGGVDYIASVNPKDIIVNLDFAKDWTAGKNYYEPTVRTPENILEWRNLSPRTLELVVTKEPN
ncbi:MAG: YbbR-like domain-containing protein [Fidelibacterota bacterium]